MFIPLDKKKNIYLKKYMAMVILSTLVVRFSVSHMLNIILVLMLLEALCNWVWFHDENHPFGTDLWQKIAKFWQHVILCVVLYTGILMFSLFSVTIFLIKIHIFIYFFLLFVLFIQPTWFGSNTTVKSEVDMESSIRARLRLGLALMF